VAVAVTEEAALPAPAAAQPSAAPEERLGLGLAEAAARESGGASSAMSGLHVVSADGAAARAGVQPGDRILAVNETSISRISSFDAALAALRQDSPVALLVLRGSILRYVPVGRPGARIPIGE
jgi:serine protease Do